MKGNLHILPIHEPDFLYRDRERKIKNYSEFYAKPKSFQMGAQVSCYLYPKVRKRRSQIRAGHLVMDLFAVKGHGVDEKEIRKDQLYLKHTT